MTYNTESDRFQLHGIKGELDFHNVRSIFERFKFPFKVKYFLTSFCNNKCFYCYTAKGVYGKKSLPTHSVFTIIERIADSATMIIELTGGEIFIRKDIFDILTKIRAENLGLILYTNGTLIDSEMCKRLLEFDNIVGIATTIFSLNKSVHDNLTRHEGSLEKTLSFLNYIQGSKLNIQCNIPVSKYNVEFVGEVIDFVVNNNIKAVINTDIYPIFKNNEIISNDCELMDAEAAIFYLNLVSRYPNLNKQKKKQACSAAKFGYTINAEGKIIGCRAHPEIYGDLLTQRIDDIRNSFEYKSLAEGIFNIPKKCNSCDASLFCNFCPATSIALGGSPEIPAKKYCYRANSIKRYIDKNLADLEK